VCDRLSALHTPVKRIIFKADFIQMGFLDIETIIFVEYGYMERPSWILE